MGGDEVSKEVEAKAPPDCAEDVTGDLLHPPHHTDAVIHLGQELEHEDKETDGHYELYLLLSDQFWHDQPKHSLHTVSVFQKIRQINFPHLTDQRSQVLTGIMPRTAQRP